MAVQQYDYAKSVHLTLLTEEIQASSIATALDNISYENDVTSVYFKDALSIADKTTLDGIITAHDASSYVDPTPVIEATFVRQEEDDSKIPYVYASPRPMNHYSYFTGSGDDPTDPNDIGGGNKVIFDMSASDTSKSVEVQFNEDVYLKDGLIISQNAPFGATIDIDVVHPLAGHILYFGKNIPVYSDYPIQLNTEDRGFVPKGMKIVMTANNSNGQNGEEPAAAFKVYGRLELYRPKPPGV